MMFRVPRLSRALVSGSPAEAIAASSERTGPMNASGIQRVVTGYESHPSVGRTLLQISRVSGRPWG